MDNEQLKRIADALEEILRMVKTDQERAQEARAHYKMEEEQSEQASGPTDGQDLSWPLALAPGPGPKLQATSCKLQAPSCKLDKTTLQRYSIL